MPSTFIKKSFALFFALLASASQARADTISNSQLGFTLTLPTAFVSRPDLVGASPDIVHAFQFGEAKEGEPVVLLLIERMRGVIGRERLTKKNMPPGFKGDLFVTKWQDFEVDGIEVPETVNGIPAVTFNVQIPLKGEAIQVKLFGPAARKEELKSLLREVLGGLGGKSNWLSSAAPTSLANSESYGMILLGIGIGVVLVGLVALWFVWRRVPKGTVLVIGVVLYAASRGFDGVRVREIKLLAASVGMIGLAGIVLGVVDLIRKRKPNAAIDKPQLVKPE